MATLKPRLNRLLPARPGSVLPLAAWLAVGAAAISGLAAGTSIALAQTGAEPGSEPGDVTWALAEEPSAAAVVPASFSRTTDSAPPAGPPTAPQATPTRSVAAAVASNTVVTAPLQDARAVSAAAAISRNQTDHALAHKPLALAPARRPLSTDPRQAVGASAERNGSPYRIGGPGWFLAVALVLSGTAVALWFGKRGSPLRRGRLPDEVFESLGKAPLSPKLEAHLLRLGGKLVLVGVQAGEARTLTEVTDPVEVQRIVTACSAAQPSSIIGTMTDAAADCGPFASSPSATASSNPSTPATSSAPFGSTSNGGDTRPERSRDGSAGSSFAANLRRSLSRLETRNA